MSKEKIISDNFSGIPGLGYLTPEGMEKVKICMDEWHKEALPTKQEIEKRFPDPPGGVNNEIHKRSGVYWCIDFQRDPAKQVTDQNSGEKKEP
jgi:hypothetical protein